MQELYLLNRSTKMELYLEERWDNQNMRYVSEQPADVWRRFWRWGKCKTTKCKNFFWFINVYQNGCQWVSQQLTYKKKIVRKCLSYALVNLIVTFCTTYRTQCSIWYVIRVIGWQRMYFLVVKKLIHHHRRIIIFITVLCRLRHINGFLRFSKAIAISQPCFQSSLLGHTWSRHVNVYIKRASDALYTKQLVRK